LATAGFQLEGTPKLVPPGWRSVTNAVSDNGVTRSVILPAADANNFFRLKK
jgi:hypothetical protein